MDHKLLIDENDYVVFAGLVCLDIVNFVEHFPVEDLSVRCLDSHWRRGGNASNSSTVFALLGGKTWFFGTLASSDEMTFLLKNLKKYGISSNKCPKAVDSACPLSIVINTKSGTRTVLHTNKNLRELTLDDLKVLDLRSDCIGWIHFEGRDNAFNIFQMISHVNDFNEKCADSNRPNDQNKIKPVITSLEVEKIRFAAGMDTYNLWRLPDVLFVSKDFAKSQGFLNMTDAVQGFFQRAKKGALVICAWGENGAAAMSSAEGLVTSPAFPPPELIDTCGAGDTFNAAVIRALSTGKNLQDSITFGCKIAGAKCGLSDYDGVEKVQ